MVDRRSKKEKGEVELDEKFDTLSGLHADQFSQELKLRLSFARVMLRMPSIVLYEESEDGDSDMLDLLLGKKSASGLVAACKLPTVEKCDRVVVIDKKTGRIGEEGTYVELI